MKAINVIVTGEHSAIKSLIKSIGYGPEDTVTHQYHPDGDEAPVAFQMEFGSLQVDEDYRIDFYGGTSPELYDFVASRQADLMTGLMMVFNADLQPEQAELDTIIKKHMPFLKKYAMVIGITGDDYLQVKQTEEQVRSILHDLDQVAPIFSVDTGLQEDVNLLVESLLCFANPGIHENTDKQVSFGP